MVGGRSRGLVGTPWVRFQVGHKVIAVSLPASHSQRGVWGTFIIRVTTKRSELVSNVKQISETKGVKPLDGKVYKDPCKKRRVHLLASHRLGQDTLQALWVPTSACVNGKGQHSLNVSMGGPSRPQCHPPAFHPFGLLLFGKTKIAMDSSSPITPSQLPGPVKRVTEAICYTTFTPGTSYLPAA